MGFGLWSEPKYSGWSRRQSIDAFDEVGGFLYTLMTSVPTLLQPTMSSLPTPITGLPIPVQQALVEHIRQNVPSLQAIYVYGSRLNGMSRAGSDLDLALLLDAASDFSPFDVFQLSGDLEAIVGCSVDLAILDCNRSVVLCKEVVSSGKRIFVNNPDAVAYFEMMALSLYAQLNEERRPIIKAYTLESVYG